MKSHNLSGLVLTLAGFTMTLCAGLIFSSSRADAACVRGVSPGDVLWIRSGPGSGYGKIGSFGPRECGIRVFWGSCSGSWCRVAKGGRSGWSHSGYLGRGGPGGGGGGGGGLCANSCFQLWVMRNQIYKNNGFCFKTKRARNYFGNAGCYTSNPSFSQWERRRINRIRRCERNNGC